MILRNDNKNKKRRRKKKFLSPEIVLGEGRDRLFLKEAAGAFWVRSGRGIEYKIRNWIAFPSSKDHTGACNGERGKRSQ